MLIWAPWKKNLSPRKQLRQKERRLAKALKIKLLKAGTIACFFLFPLFSQGTADNFWQFDSELQKAYSLILNLKTDQAYTLLLKNTKSYGPHRMYLLTFCETVDILITEDAKKFEGVELKFKDRLSQLELLPESAETLFLQAEINLQKGFSYINLNQELNAVIAIRRAYNFTQECLKKYPGFIPIKKTSGVIQVMVGSVPDKFHWFMSLLGMKGSVSKGQKQLEELRLSKSSLKEEASIHIDERDKLLGLLDIKKEEFELNKSNIDKFNFFEKDKSINKELIEDLDYQIQTLNTERYRITYEISKIEDSLSKIVAEINIDKLKMLHDEVSLFGYSKILMENV